MLPDAEPISRPGGPDGVLVCHGFTGSPQSVKPLANAFTDAGFAVEVPLLPGHGTTPEAMNETRWSDWSRAAEDAYLALAGTCERVIVAGLSMGGALVAWLGTRHPEIAALIAVNPLIDPRAPIWANLVRTASLSEGEYLPAVGSDIARPGVVESAYEAVPVQPLLDLTGHLQELFEQLPKITSPSLIFVSPQDHVVDPESGYRWAERTSGEATIVDLPDSYHVATLDYDQERINEKSVQFARRGALA